jgi:hypothetical protein
MFRDQNAGPSHNIKFGSNSFERVEQFKHLRKNLKNQNSIEVEIKGRFKSGMLANIRCRIFCPPACYPNIKIYRIIILPFVLFGCVTWLLTLRDKRRMRVFQNRILRRIFGPKRDEATGDRRKLHNEYRHDMYFSENIIWMIKLKIMSSAGM